MPIRYSSDVWEFDGYPLVNQTVSRLDFDGVPPRWRTIVKDWTLLRLNPHLALSGDSGLDVKDVMTAAAAAERPIKLMSAVAYVGCFATSLTLIDRHGWERLGPEDWAQFATDLRDAFPTAAAQTIAGYARPLLSLWTMRGLLWVPDMFGGRPFNGRTVESVFKVPNRDLNVDRPAPELCGPLLGLSLWILDHCAEDILARLERLSSVADIGDQPRDTQVAAVNELLLAWERTGRPLPATVGLRGDVTGPVPSWATFVKLAGASSQALRNPVGAAQKTLARLRDERGLSSEEDGFNLPIASVRHATGDMRPWTAGLPATRYGAGLEYWAGILGYCCAFIVVALTTVRDRELAAIPDSCLVEDSYERGDIDVPVTRMRGYLVKNRLKPAPATWVVGDDVIRAVRTVHRLKAALRLLPRIHPETGEEVLFHPGLGGIKATDQTSVSLQLRGGYLARFASAGQFLAERGFVPALPELPLWLAHRTIRITGIEAYASQAWGDALAAAQAHWSSRKVAEGYFGHLPRSVFVADPDSVEEVRQIVMAQSLADVAADLDAGIVSVAGNGAPRLEAALDKSHVHEIVNGPVTGRQLVKIAKSNPNVFVGEFTICVHGSGGLCGNEAEADFKLCRPFACRNSAMTVAQRARLELRRRGWLGKDGAFDRARRKLEADAPTIAAEFSGVDDETLREMILSDLPGRYMLAAQGSLG